VDVLDRDRRTRQQAGSPPESRRDARLLWEIDTARDYTTVNGVLAYGGAMDGPGPIAVNGMLYVNSGYAQWGGLPGNVLLAFEVGNP
jgi:polyvinyl alcohol dehydrogenase (cytochrome)